MTEAQHIEHPFHPDPQNCTVLGWVLAPGEIIEDGDLFSGRLGWVPTSIPGTPVPHSEGRIWIRPARLLK